MEPSPAEKDFQCRKWFCTINNPNITLTQFCERLKGLGATKGVVQLEEGESGTPHFQGAFEFDAVKRASQLNKIVKGAYTKQLVKQSATKGPYTYCCKEEGRLEGPIQWGIPIPRPLLTGLEGIALVPWQEQLFARVKEPCIEMREAWWYWSAAGKKGKSSTGRHLYDQGGAVYVSLMRDTADTDKNVKCAIATALDPELVGSKREAIDVTHVIIDIPRDATIDYSIIETVKNCLFFNSKYKPCTVRYAPVHLTIFANWPPDDTSTGIGSARLNVVCLD